MSVGARSVLSLILLTAIAAVHAPSLVAAPSTAPAASRPSEPRQLIQQATDEMVLILADKSLSTQQKGDRLGAAVGQYIDYPTLARLTVASHWPTFTDKQRADFIQLFTDHLLGIYAPLAILYDDQQVFVSSGRPESNGDYTVFVVVNDRKEDKDHKHRQVADITCRMRKGPEGWRTIDLTVEGVSMAQIFRSQFQPVIAKSGVDGLLERLRQKNAQLRSGQ